MNDEPDWVPSVAAQIRALKMGPRARRLRFRELELVCSRCGDTLAEVLKTTPGPVLTYRRATDFDEVDDAHLEFRMHLLVHGPLDVGERLVLAGCRCAKHKIRLDEVYASLAAGKPKKLAMAPPAHDTENPTSKEVMRRALKAIGREPRRTRKPF